MKQIGNRSECSKLERLQQSFDDCLARHIPVLEKQFRALQRRCHQGQPIGRALQRLKGDIENSIQSVDQRRVAAPSPRFDLQLPVVEERGRILAAITKHQVVVLCGETGSGKTTQLPKICLELGRGVRGMIGHTQPRRLAARSLAARVAVELQSPLGRHVGYKIRFQDRVQETSYVKVMTDGILLAEIQSDPELRQYDTLIIDEAHERSLNIDFLLGYLHRLLPDRPDLKLIITSATIDPQRFALHFNGAPVIEVSGRTWPVDVRYRPLAGDDDDQKDRGRGQAILDAVDELAAEGPGDVLVFLPGERAIRETSELLRKHHPPHTEILPLYARLSAAQQNQIFTTHRGRRIVLATNVAETSLTVPGIRYVVDVGLARISRYSYRTKVQRLPIEAISQASAKQRAGRCGRVESGTCLRLYSEDDYLARPEFTDPEIRRTNLAAVILQMAALGLGGIEAFPFLDPPDLRFVRDGYKLLQELGAVDEEHRLTRIGRQIARLPVDPRLARMILEGKHRHCLSETLIIVSALEVADPRERPMDHAQAADEKHALFNDSKSDFLSYLNLWNAYRAQVRHVSKSKLRKWCREHFLSFLRMQEWSDVHRQLQVQVTGMGMSCNDVPADYREIHCALLAGLLGNIAFQSEPGEYLGARNLKFMLFPGSGLFGKKPKWLVAGELVETGRRYLRTAAHIDPAWVEPLARHLVRRSYSEPHWEKKRAQVVVFERVTLYGLPLVQRRKVNFGPLDRGTSRALFIRHALVQGEFETSAAFAAHNQRLLTELERLESKSRRRDVLVDEDELFRFFDERLPPSVYDGPRFHRWWKKVGTEQPKLLHLDRDSIMRHDAEAVTEQQFPDSIEVRGLCLPVHYRFSPGETNDGLCVRVPLAALNQLQDSDFDWLVPGLLREKVMLLIKSLAKQWRRHFVPVPDVVDACLKALQRHDNPLIDALTDQLQRLTGVSVPKSAWRPALLPEHLFASFELLDEQGRKIATGRRLTELQAQFGESASDDFARLSDKGFERTNIQDWDFGDLPEAMELERHGVTLRGYPGLTFNDGVIGLRLFDQQEQAVKSHREGLLALFRRRAGRVIKEIRRSVPDMQKQTLWFSTVADAETLQTDLERAVIQAAFLQGDPIVREAEVFRQRLDEGRQQLVQLATAIGSYSFEALQAYQQLNSMLKGAFSPQLLAATQEVREQVQGLIYPGFISATPLCWLPHLARYLRAASQRLAKLPGNAQRDRKQSAVVRRFWQDYEQALRTNPTKVRLTDFRWLIEELRVSLFAQELGTSVKVSPERLERLCKELS